MSSIEAYARIYNLEHWVTDVVGGVIFGSCGLAVMISVFSVLDRDEVQPARGQHVERGAIESDEAASERSPQPA